MADVKEVKSMYRDQLDELLNRVLEAERERSPAHDYVEVLRPDDSPSTPLPSAGGEGSTRGSRGLFKASLSYATPQAKPNSSKVQR